MPSQKHKIHTNKSNRKLAYHFYDGDKSKPVVIFLGGFKSDMEGTKALFLEGLCKGNDIPFIRFDYSGHGISDGQFEDGSIGEWFEDAMAIIDSIAEGRKCVLIGSSMGGWISLLCAKDRPDSVLGMILLAPAPDFTSEILKQFSEKQKASLYQDGFVSVPNDYSDEPYIFTKKLLDDGEKHCLLTGDINSDIPVIILQGMRDADVPWRKALKIQECLSSEDVEVLLIKDAGHSLSRDQDLETLAMSLKKLLAKL